MNSVNSGWVKLWRELLSKSIWIQSSPQCCKVLITILLLANHEKNEWEYKGEKHKCEPGQLITSIDSLVSTCGLGVTKEGVRSAISRLVKLGFITNVSTKSGRLITVVNWDKYQDANYVDPKGHNNGVAKKEGLKVLKTGRSTKNKLSDNLFSKNGDGDTNGDNIGNPIDTESQKNAENQCLNDNVYYGNPKAYTNGDTIPNPKDTPKTPQRHPKDTPPNKKDKNDKNERKEKEINKEKESADLDADDWWNSLEDETPEEWRQT